MPRAAGWKAWLLCLAISQHVVAEVAPCAGLALEVERLARKACEDPHTAVGAFTVEVSIRQASSAAAPHLSLALPLECGPSEAEGPLLEDGLVWKLCAAWAAFWLLLHILCHWAPAPTVLLGAVMLLESSSRLKPLGKRRAKWRQLARAQVYNVLAVMAGSLLASEYGSCKALAWHFTWRHQVAFTAAVGHWLVAFLETWSDMSRLSGWYRLHHLAAALAFALCLRTRRLSSVGVGGLIFEFPVIFENVLVALRLRGSLAALRYEDLCSLWDATLWAVMIGRAAPLLIYAYSLLAWQDEWRGVPHAWAWNAAFGVFSVFSLGWYCLLHARRTLDLDQSQAAQKCAAGSRAAAGQPPTSEHTQLLGAPSAVDEAADASEMQERCSQKIAERPAPQTLPSGDATPSRVIAGEELLHHNTAESCWLAVHGAVCDVTAFLEEHPGGAARLLAHAGTDASAAFDAVGHSEAARARLSGLAVGRLVGETAAPAGQAAPAAPSAPPAPAPGAKAGAAGRSQRSRAGRPDHYHPLYAPKGVQDTMRPLAGAAAASWGLLLLRWLPGERRLGRSLVGLGLAGVLAAAPAAWASLRSAAPAAGGGQAALCGVWPLLANAVALAALSVALQLAPSRCLALGCAGALLAGELQAASSAGGRTSLFEEIFRWGLFLCYLIPQADDAPSLSYWASLSCSAAVATAVPTLCRNLDHLARPCLLPAAGLGALLLWAALPRPPEEAAAPWPAWPGSLDSALPLAASTASPPLAWALVWQLSLLTAKTSPRAVATGASLLLGLPLAAAWLTRPSGILAFSGWWLQVKARARRLEDFVKTPGMSEAHYTRHLQCAVDFVRGYSAMLLWVAVSRPLEAFVSWLLPADMRVYAFETPISDLGGRLKVGVCLMLEGEQVDPGYVVCNVGHIPDSHYRDVRATVTSAVDIMEELSQGVPGFVSNVLCVVPDVRAHRAAFEVDWRSLREINLSVWASEGAAMDWYRRSPAHAAILEAHRHGGLEVFGNMLMSMRPTQVHWQRRCRACAGLVAGLRSERCPCGGKTHPIPVF